MDGLPVIKRTKIQTKSVVQSHGSLLIGGYYVERSEKGNIGVPIMKDIPFIGRAFRREVKQKEKLTRLFLLTPKIVSRKYKRDMSPKPKVVSYLDERKEEMLKNSLNQDQYPLNTGMIFD